MPQTLLADVRSKVLSYLIQLLPLPGPPLRCRPPHDPAARLRDLVDAVEIPGPAKRSSLTLQRRRKRTIAYRTHLNRLLPHGATPAGGVRMGHAMDTMGRGDVVVGGDRALLLLDDGLGRRRSVPGPCCEIC